MTDRDTSASGTGRARTVSLQRRHAERRELGVRRRRLRGRTRRPPKRDSIAGSSVSVAASVSSTAITEATARPYVKLTPVANIPSNAITTVAPASRIARPDVSIAPSTDCSTSPSAAKFSRNRVTMNSA